ncbi:hypothetical protein ACH41E_25050 [Streptomyces sp. NPDC020412]|uniref:hypothetical protein n=1 Tax=Streptomyces sp. NPDC020412 TaxID=3365073 RepID=UPI0037B77CC2
MTPAEAPSYEALRAAFGQDLATDWIPDAVGAVDVAPFLLGGAPSGIDAARLRVPLGSRTEDVPVVPVDVRARLHGLVERALCGHRVRPEVLAYDRVDWDYRHAFRTRQQRLTELAARPELPLVLALDVHRLSRSLPLRALHDAPWATPELSAALAALDRAAGRPLLPGHRWANRLAAAVLSPVDTVVARLAPGRWLRWGDDWHVFVHAPAEADEVREAVGRALAPLGLAPSEHKTRTLPATTVLSGTARDVRGDPGDAWRRGLEQGDARALRYALPRAAPTPQISRSVPGAVRHRPELLPRAVQYLARAVDTPEGRAAVRALLPAASPFTCARLLALAATHRALAADVPDELLTRSYASGSVALRSLATRVAALTTRLRLTPDPPPRLRPWLALGADPNRWPPLLTTLL